MVYCDQDMCDSKLGKFMQAFRADRPDEWQMDEFIRMAEDMNNEITRLRQAEKDAARYRWLDEQNKNVMSKVMACNGWIDDGDDVEYVSDIASFIDEAMQCK